MSTKGYLKSFFVIDLIATFPYSHTNPQLIYLRFVKLAKIQQFNHDLTTLILSMIGHCIQKNKQMSVVALIKLIFLVLCMAHLMACFWMVVGQENLEAGEPNWITQAEAEVFQDRDFMSMYISAFYLVILTFTSIGYGDIRPESATSTSMLYGLLVLMMGMIINGYMIGTFQTIMKEI